MSLGMLVDSHIIACALTDDVGCWNFSSAVLADNEALNLQKIL